MSCVAHVNVDLPGRKTTSVISDNFWGAQQLTLELIAKSRPLRAAARNRPYFLGGLAADHATARRIEGFSDAVRTELGELDPAQIDACGYEPDLAEAAIAALYKRLKGLPRALFVNSTIALEGVVRFLKTLPHDELDRCTGRQVPTQTPSPTWVRLRLVSRFEKLAVTAALPRPGPTRFPQSSTT